MRWLTCAVAAALVIAAAPITGYLEAAAFLPLMLLIGALALSNLVYGLFLKRNWFSRTTLIMQIYIDLMFLTAMLHYGGGIENPLCFAYIFHIIFAGIFFDRKRCYWVVAAAAALFGAMALAELGGLLYHYTLHVFPHPPHYDAPRELLHASHEPLYVVSVVGLYWIFFALTVHFTLSVAERQRREENRAKTERQRLERVVGAVGAGIVVLDAELAPIWRNDRIAAWFPPETTGSDLPAGRQARAGRPESLSTPSEADRLPACLTEWIASAAKMTLGDGKVRMLERERVGPEGDRRCFQITIAPVTDRAGNTSQVVALIQNITEQKMIEAGMAHAGKMAALGVMAAGIAHEVGNPLASISARLALLRDTPDAAFARASVPLLETQIGRIASIVRGISQFARPARHEWSACRMDDLVKETVAMLRLHRAAKKNEIVTDLAERLPATMGDRNQLLQVFLNLGINALEAMPDGGRLIVATAIAEDRLRITFRDTGGGISPEARRRLFEPFFTTKGAGLGLGLYLANGIAQAHGGALDATPAPGGGTVVGVSLPVWPRQPADGAKT